MWLFEDGYLWFVGDGYVCVGGAEATFTVASCGCGLVMWVRGVFRVGGGLSLFV